MTFSPNIVEDKELVWHLGNAYTNVENLVTFCHFDDPYATLPTKNIIWFWSEILWCIATRVEQVSDTEI